VGALVAESAASPGGLVPHDAANATRTAGVTRAASRRVEAGIGWRVA